MKKIVACLLVCLIAMSALPLSVAFAAEDGADVFTLNVTSNYFPDESVSYPDLSKYEDANGDVFLTVEWKMLAAEKYLINMDMRALTWDNKVLEFKEAYNMTDDARKPYFNIFPFAGKSSIINTFDDANTGRWVGNYSAVQNCAYGYEEDGSAITVIRVVFKVIDRTAGETTLNCNLVTMSLCDESIDQPYAQYSLVEGSEVAANADTLASCSTAVAPDPNGSDVLIGDVNLDGKVDITDATYVQMAVAKMITLDAQQQANADTNGDGKTDITDATYIQMYVAKMIDHLG